MLAGGIALAVPPFLGPPNSSEDTRDRLTDLAANPTTSLTESLLFQAAVLLLLPGVVAIAGRVRGRGSAAVVSGAVVYGAGLVGAFAFMVMGGIEVALATTGPIDDTIVRASDALGSSAAFLPAGILAIFLFHLIGLPWLAFGMVRARMLPLLAALVATAGTISTFFGSGTRFESVGWVVLGGTLAYIGWTVARPTAPTSAGVASGPLATSAAGPGPLISAPTRHCPRMGIVDLSRPSTSQADRSRSSPCRPVPSVPRSPYKSAVQRRDLRRTPLLLEFALRDLPQLRRRREAHRGTLDVPAGTPSGNVVAWSVPQRNLNAQLGASPSPLAAAGGRRLSRAVPRRRGEPLAAATSRTTGRGPGSAERSGSRPRGRRSRRMRGGRARRSAAGRRPAGRDLPR
jgi:hypothetical protein